MGSGQIADRRSRRAGVGVAAYFLITGVTFATWASRVPAIKGGLDLSDGQFAVALLGLEAGAILGLQLGGLMVPRVGSRRALTASLAVFACALLGPAFAPSLLLLAASLFAFAALNSVVDVAAMNAQGVALQRLIGRPVLSRLHAMHSLGASSAQERAPLPRAWAPHRHNTFSPVRQWQWWLVSPPGLSFCPRGSTGGRNRWGMEGTMRAA